MTKKTTYWTAKEDELMLVIFNTGTTRREYNRAFEAVLPRLKFMAKQILHRYYFVIDDGKKEELCMDAIILLCVNGKYNASRGTKLYSYCGTIIKHYFHDKLVIPHLYKTKIDALNSVDDNYDICEDEWIADTHATQPEFDTFDTDEKQELIDAAIQLFEKNIEKIDAEINSKQRKEKTKKLNREKQWLLSAIQYLKEFGGTGNIDVISLADYTEKNCVGITSSTQRGYLYKYVGISCDINRRDSDDNKSLIEDKIAQYGLSYLMDDYCPFDKNLRRSYRTKKLKVHTREYNYF